MEYKVVRFNLSHVNLGKELNEIAKEGWGLVAIASFNIFIFARHGKPFEYHGRGDYRPLKGSQ